MRKSQASYIAASAVVLAMVATPLALAADGGGGAGAGDGEARAAQNVTGSSATFAGSNPRYTLFARNSAQGNGGAQADTCTSNIGNEACFNMVNFGTGYAGSFRTRGNVGFLVQTSGAGQATPFQLTPNATGVVQYLNADTVDGLDSSDLQGKQGPAGPTGPTGPAGANGVSGYQQLSNTSSSTTLAVGANPVAISQSCPSGKQIISQGASVSQSANSGGGTAVVQGASPTSSTAAQASIAVVGGAGATATFTATLNITCAST